MSGKQQRSTLNWIYFGYTGMMVHTYALSSHTELAKLPNVKARLGLINIPNYHGLNPPL